MTRGNKWTFQNVFPLSPTMPASVVMTIQDSPSLFSCAPTPIALNIYKTDPRVYWAVGSKANMHWMLGVRTDIDVIAFGHYWRDFDGNPRYGTEFYRTQIGYDRKIYPPYVLLRQISPFTFPSPITVPMVYFGGPNNPELGTCPATPVTTPNNDGLWSATRSYQYVATPAFTGTSVMATYEEEFAGLKENWYFASGIGPVRIVQQHYQSGQWIQTAELKLVEYAVNQNRSIVPSVRFRDAIISAASQTSGLSFDQWNHYYTQVTHQPGPSPEAACLNPAFRGNPIPVDQYLTLLEQRGTSCSSEPWPSLANLENAASMEPYFSDGLRWDVWKYYYPQSGLPGIPLNPEDACQLTVTYYDTDLGNFSTAAPNRWIRYTARQWYALIRHAQLGGSCL